MTIFALDSESAKAPARSLPDLTARVCSVPATQTSVVYLDGGHGEPIIFLHASASSSAQWRTIAGGLDPRYRPVLVDLFGYGGTPAWRHRRPMLLADEARHVEAVLDRIGGPAHIVGHSYGGAVALRVAADRPERVRSLVLIEPVAFHMLRMSPARDADFLEIYGLAREIGRLVIAGRSVEAMRRFVDYWSGEGTWAAMPPERQEALVGKAGKVVCDFRAAIAEDRMPNDYRRFRFPSLVVSGTSSPRPARAIAGLLAGTLPCVEMATIESAGHMAPLTHGGEVAALVERHLVDADSSELRRCA